MELYTVLRNIIDVDGQDILSNIKLINVLNDFNAFNSHPATKYVLKAFIENNFIRQMLDIGNSDANISMLSLKVTNTTGFMPEVVGYVIQSLKYGLRWSDDIPVIYNGQQQPLFPSQYSASTHFKNLSKNEQEKFLSKLIHIEPYIEAKYNMKVKANASISYSTLYVNIEVSGKLEQNDLSLFIAIYNKQGEFKDYNRLFKFDMRPSESSFCCTRIFFDGFLSSNGDRCIDYDIEKMIIFAHF